MTNRTLYEIFGFIIDKRGITAAMPHKAETSTENPALTFGKFGQVFTKFQPINRPILLRSPTSPK